MSTTNIPENRKWLWFLSVILTVLAVVSYFWSTTQKPTELQLISEDGFENATLLPQAKPLSTQLQLQDQHNMAFTIDRLQGQWSLLFFGYTSCPDVCPIELAILKRVLENLGEIEKPQVILVSVDPETDSPAILKAYLQKFSDDFIGLTGKTEEIKRFAKELGVYHEKEKTTQPVSHSSNAEHDHSQHMANQQIINHTSTFILINPLGQYQAIFSTPHDAKKVAESYKKIIAN